VKFAAIPAEVAYDCLETIPNEQAPALDLLYALQPLFEFQTTIAYLKNPPEGYLFPALDFWAEFNKIVSNVQNGAYNSKSYTLLSAFSLTTAYLDTCP
jgi:hypothetical protein